MCEHPRDALESSTWIYVRGMLTDWRLWGLGFGGGLAAGLVSTLFGYGGNAAGAAVGVTQGLYCVARLGRVFRCTRCGETVRLPLGEAPPSRHG
jgi:hypothetical protein